MASKILSKKDFKYKLSQAKSLPQHKEDINLFKDKSTLEKWSGYTLQVMASYSLDAIVKFKKNSRLKKNMYIYETVNGYKHWYVLIYANFGTYAEAKKYQEQLNKFHHVNGAWVKSLNSVHYEMRRSLV